MKILAIIVTFNGIKWIDKCLSSIVDSTVKNADIFVVDNGSTDGTVEYIKSNYGQAILIESKKNLGFGQANNIGFKYALDNAYDYVYLMNQDAWVKEDTLESLVILHQQKTEYGILSPLQVNSECTKLDNHFRHCLFNYTDEKIIDDFLLKEVNKVYTVTDVMAAHWLMPIETIKKVGGFSPTFDHYGEDNNYINRLLFHGYKCGISTQVIGIHDRENRTLSLRKSVFYYYIKGLVSLSNPLVTIKIGKKISFILRMFFYIFLIRSFYPVKLLIKLFFSTKKIRENKRKSETDYLAFLN